MRLVPLQAQNGETVLINPDQVRSVIIMGIGSKTEFGPDHAVPVTATLENIQKLLAEPWPGEDLGATRQRLATIIGYACHTSGGNAKREAGRLDLACADVSWRGQGDRCPSLKKKYMASSVVRIAPHKNSIRRNATPLTQILLVPRRKATKRGRERL